MSYELLSEPIRRYIRDKKWDALRPIQSAAISRILTTEDNYILASRTASGKTEAAFLPILSKVNFDEPGVQVLYISPLIALINDQFSRVEELCKYMEVPITKWHGEASKAAKDRLIKSPGGIVLITPESIEAMLANHPYNAKALFRNLKFVVIDEIHSFLGSDRGLHLKSLLHRLRQLNATPARVIGLSATIGDFEEAKRFLGDTANTKVLLDKTAKEITASFRYEKTEKSLSPEFLNKLYEETKNSKALIFPNSRGRVEEVAVGLKKASERNKGHAHYFAHHSSVDREHRERIEGFAKNNTHQPFSIVCTSTLEMGIDIGSVDVVVQIDAAHSIASLIQRIGRSGRRKDAKSSLLLYATDGWQLLQAYACWELYRAGFIEPITSKSLPFDLLFHQILSILKERSGISRDALLGELDRNPVFGSIAPQRRADLIQYMIEADYVEDLKRELIVGISGEKLTSSRDFYSMFSTPEMFKVINAGKQIGEVPLSPMVKEDENIFLAASIWKIRDVDEKAKKIVVVQTSDGKPPLFFGDGGSIHARVRQRMLELLYTDHIPEWSDESAISTITELRKEFQPIPVEDLECERPFVVKENGIHLYTFTSTQIDNTIAFLLERMELDSQVCEGIYVRCNEFTPATLVERLQRELQDLDHHLSAAFEARAETFPISKWGQFLPVQLQRQHVLETYFDVEGTAEFLEQVTFVKEVG